MSDRLEDTSLRLKDEMDLYKRMMDKLRQNRLEFQKEREATQEVGPSQRAPGLPPVPLLPPTSPSPTQLIEDLRKELEHLQMYKLDCERPGRGRSSSTGLGEFSARAREVELEHEIKRLKQVGPGSLCPAGRGVQVPAGGFPARGPRAGAPASRARSTGPPGCQGCSPSSHSSARRLTSRPRLMEISGSPWHPFFCPGQVGWRMRLYPAETSVSLCRVSQQALSPRFHFMFLGSLL